MPLDPRFAPGQIVKGKTICGAKNKQEKPCGISIAEGATRRERSDRPPVTHLKRRKLTAPKGK
ncbi:hypothetical protein ABIE37_000943 [Arthrobacter bambusae]|uniref:Uncharacterized protein n=1 Tax=Arthrobacter bambusae TaxID=1338426 RepID=A0ABV2P378_9MICC